MLPPLPALLRRHSFLSCCLLLRSPSHTLSRPWEGLNNPSMATRPSTTTSTYYNCLIGPRTLHPCSLSSRHHPHPSITHQYQSLLSQGQLIKQKQRTSTHGPWIMCVPIYIHRTMIPCPYAFVRIETTTRHPPLAHVPLFQRAPPLWTTNPLAIGHRDGWGQHTHMSCHRGLSNLNLLQLSQAPVSIKFIFRRSRTTPRRTRVACLGLAWKELIPLPVTRLSPFLEHLTRRERLPEQ